MNVHGPGDDRSLPLILLSLLPAVAVSGRAVDALWMSAGVVFVSVLASLARHLLSGAPAAVPDAAPVPGPAAGAAPGPDLHSARELLGALVISSVLAAVFEAGLLAVSPPASAALGIYAPLIAVNVLSLDSGRSARASLAAAAAAAVVRGLLFAAGLLSIAVVREALGAGTITLFPVGAFKGTIAIGPLLDQPVRALGFAGGALLCLGYLAGLVRAVSDRPRTAPRGEELR